jgi:hypothetical protein
VSAAVVVDSHVHLLPERLAARVRGYFEERGLAGVWAYPLDTDAVLEELQRDGVDEVWTLPYAHRPGVAAWLNEAIAELAARPGPLSVVAGATVHPGDDDPLGIVRTATDDLGARVLKLHCSVGGFDADDERLDPVWEHAAAARVPVVVHVGHAGSGRTESEELAPVGRVATRHPGAVVVVAHSAFPATGAALDLVCRHPGIHLDLTPVLRDPVGLTRDELVEHADRILFGSDTPNVAIRAAAGLAALRALDLPAGALAAITGGNARRLTTPPR